MANNFASGTTPMPTDTIRVLEAKILAALNAGGGSGTTGTISTGSGAPVGAPTGLPFYIDTANGNTLYMYYGGTWN